HARRFSQGLRRDKQSLLDRLKSHFAAHVDIRYGKECEVQVNLKPGALAGGKVRGSFDSIVLKTIAEKLPPYEDYDPAIWPTVINARRVDEILKASVAPAYAKLYAERCRAEHTTRGTHAAPTTTLVGRPEPETKLKAFVRVFENRLAFESSMAGTLLF